MPSTRVCSSMYNSSCQLIRLGFCVSGGLWPTSIHFGSYTSWGLPHYRATVTIPLFKVILHVSLRLPCTHSILTAAAVTVCLCVSPLSNAHTHNIPTPFLWRSCVFLQWLNPFVVLSIKLLPTLARIVSFGERTYNSPGSAFLWHRVAESI